MSLDYNVALVIFDVLAKSVDTTHCLEQRMVFYLIIYIENSGARGIKACKQLVDYN